MQRLPKAGQCWAAYQKRPGFDLSRGSHNFYMQPL